MAYKKMAGVPASTGGPSMPKKMPGASMPTRKISGSQGLKKR